MEKVIHNIDNFQTVKRSNGMVTVNANRFDKLCEKADCWDNTNFDRLNLTEINTEYPFNLLCAIFRFDFETIMQNGELAQVAYAVEHFEENWIEVKQSLAEREQKVIELRYKHALTLEECGKELCVSRGRIRQIEAKTLNKLRHPSISSILYYGKEQSELNQRITKARAEFVAEISAYERKLASLRKIFKDLSQEYDTNLQVINNYSIDINDLDLSKRSCNCLMRSGIKTLGELSEKTVEELMKLRNLGKRILKEVIDKCAEYGVTISHEEVELKDEE